jgi:hypothetical protein
VFSLSRSTKAGAFVSKAVAAGKEELFKAAIPKEARPYAALILRVADEQNVDPFIITALGVRETHWGKSLRADRTGDCTKRNTTPNIGKHVYPYPMPPDGLCWGRGLMQIDYGWHLAWLSSHDWRDDYTNLTYAIGSVFLPYKAQLAKAGVVEPQLTPATLAAYNAGVANVLKKLRAGEPVDSVTEGKDYSRAVLASAASYASKFNVA